MRREGLTVKAVSLYPPYGTGIALLLKRFETRSWLTRYRGVLVIHQTLAFPRACKEFCARPDISEALALSGYASWRDLPRGKIVAVTEVVNCYHTEELVVSGVEAEWGDYTPGRYAWQLKLLFPVVPPLEADGQRGMFDFTVPSAWIPDIERQVREQQRFPDERAPEEETVAADYRLGLFAALSEKDEDPYSGLTLERGPREDDED